MLHTMSTTAEASCGRSAAEVNEEIRALWRRSGGILTSEQRAEYQRLVMEWAAAPLCRAARSDRTPQPPSYRREGTHDRVPSFAAPPSLTGQPQVAE